MSDKVVWIISGDSESGDTYDPVTYDHKPTAEDKKHYIKNFTNEDLNIDGPGDYGSYVYLKITRCKVYGKAEQN